MTDNHVGLQSEQFFRECRQPSRIAGGPAMINPEVAAIHPPQFGECLVESRYQRLCFCIALCQARQHANTTYHGRLLSARSERPHHCCAAEDLDEIAPSHSPPPDRGPYRAPYQNVVSRSGGLRPASLCAW